MRSTSRTLLAAVVTVLASVAILVTLLAHYANVLASSSSFSDNAVRLVRTRGVESLIVDDITRRLEAELGVGTVLQPLIRDAVHSALSNGQITGEVRAAAASLQNQLVSGDANALALTLPNIGPAIASTIQPASPQLAQVVSRIGTVTVLDVRIPSNAAAAIHDLAQVGRDASLLIVFSAALIALALILSVDRRRTLRGLGLGTLVSGLVAAAIYLAGRSFVVGQFSDPTARTAAGTAWRVYLGGLESSGLVLAVIGLVVAAALLLGTRSRQHPRFAGV